MKKWFKRGLFALVALVIVTVIGAAVFLLTFDPNAYKNKVEQLVYERYQRQLNIDGEIELSLFPRIGLSVADVSLSDRNSNEPFAAVDSARFAVAVWPLLWNNLVVDHVAVSGFKVWLSRDEQGNFNFMDLLQRRKIKPPTSSISTTKIPSISHVQAQSNTLIPDADQTEFQIDIAGLDLKEGQIHFLDMHTQTQLQLINLEVNTGRMTFDQPFDVIFKGILKGDKPVADATLEGQTVLKLEPQLKRYIAQRMNVSLVGQVGSYYASSASFRGDVELLTLTEDLRAKQIEILTQGRWQDASFTLNKANLSLTAAQLNLKRNLDILNTNKLRIRATGLLPVETDQAENKLELALDIPQLSVEPEKVQSEPIALSFKQTQGAALLGINTHVKNLSGTLKQLQLNEMQWDLAGKNKDTAWKLDSIATAHWEQDNLHLHWQDMIANLRIDDDALEPNPAHAKITGAGSWDYTQENVSFAGLWQSANTQAQLKATLKKDKTWQLGLQVNADEMDLNPWISSKERRQKVQSQRNAKTKTEISKPAFNNEMLHHSINWANWQTDVDLQAGKLKIANSLLQDVTFKAQQKEGNLQMQQLEANIFEGSVNATGEWQLHNDYVELKAKLNEVDLMRLSSAFAAPLPIGGIGNIEIDLHTQGPTKQAWLAALEGQAQLQAQNGAIVGWDFLKQLNTANQAVRNVFSGQVTPPVESFDGQQSTSFSDLDLKIQLHQGQAQIEKLNGQTKDFVMQVEPHAYLDMANHHIEMDLRFDLNKDATVSNGLQAYADHPIYLRLSGPWSNPVYRFQWQRLAHPTVQDAIDHGLLGMLGRPDLGTLIRATEPKAAAPNAVEGAAKTIGNTLKDLLKK